jgi:hypothetical protein
MADLVDYSGAFDPNLKYEDFSKDVLVRLLGEYTRCYLTYMGEWHRVMRERFSDQAALECETSVWNVAAPLSAGYLCRSLNIQGDNVETFFKALQVNPAFPLRLFDIEWELVNANLGYITVKKCSALNAFEKEGLGYELLECHVEEPPTMINTAFYHNPNLIFKPVKLPPREDKGGIACKWETRLVKPEENPFPHSKAGNRTRQTPPKDPREAGRPWSEEQIRVLWGYLSEGIRDVMRVIARKPEGCLKDDIVRELGISAEEMSFRLGFIYLALFETPWQQKWVPVRLQKSPWRYEMDKEWAEAIIKLSL